MRLLMVLFFFLSLAVMIGITTATSSGGTSVDTGGGFSIDCPCIDVSSILISASNCIVENTDDEPGIWVFEGTFSKSTCIPVTFGSSTCVQPLSVLPSCQVENYNISKQDVVRLPDFCYESFCYVDKNLCRDSSETFRRSLLFDFLPEVTRGSDHNNRLYYSCSTCNSTDYYNIFTKTQAAKKQFISAVVPKNSFPYHVKQGYNNNKLVGYGTGNESLLYKNDSIPWHGVLIDYLNDVLDISNIGGINYTHRSGGSAIVENVYTASVYDVQNEIGCLGVGNYWVTSERLQMTPFTTPLAIDKIMLWIRNPHDTNGNSYSRSFRQQIFGIYKPFEPSLWFTLIASLLVVSIMHIWFTTKKEERNVWREKFRDEAYKNGTVYFKTTTVLNVILDSFLDSTQMVLGASIDFDADTYTSRKILNFGFGLLILVTITGYTANLAAFLTTRSIQKPFIESIEDAIVAKIPLCAHTVLKNDLILAYPDAIWVFTEDKVAFGYDIYNGMHETFDNGDCMGIVAGVEEVLMDTKIMTSFCDQKLVHTESVVLEMSIALPACKDIVASISHWIYEAKLRGIQYESYREQSQPTKVCQLSLKQNQFDGDDDSLQQLTVANFTIPLLVLGFCCAVSAFLQFRHQTRGHKRRTMLLSRDDVVGFEEEKDEEKEREDIDNDHQQQYQHQRLFQQQIVLPLIQDIQPKDPATILRTLRELRNYQNDLQIYERDLFDSMVEEQQNKEHEE